MDKYKTSQLGVALKKVFRGEITVDDSVKLASDEIKSVFDKRTTDKEYARNDIGFMGDVMGKCPVCGSDVVRTRFGYGCSGYRDGCKFSVSMKICSAVISGYNVRKLLETGYTDKIDTFVSPKSGKSFSARMKLQDGKTVFDFT